MSLAVWSDIFKTGIEELDNQHRRPFDIANAYHEALEAGRDKTETFHILNRLVSYVEEHFQDEEKILKEAGCPAEQLALLHMEHDDLTEQIFILHQRFTSDDHALGEDLEKFLRGWLLDHILDTDRSSVSLCEQLHMRPPQHRRATPRDIPSENTMTHNTPPGNDHGRP